MAPDPELCVELGSEIKLIQSGYLIGISMSLICKLDLFMKMFSFKNLDLIELNFKSRLSVFPPLEFKY